jgi:hypothetical protein
MKPQYQFFLIFLVISICSSFAQKANFFIKPSLVGTRGIEVEGAIGLFASEFENYVKEIYPCAIITTEADLGNLMGHERQCQLLGSGSADFDENIKDALDCDYLIVLEIGILVDDKFTVTASLIPYRTKPKIPIVRASAYSDFNNNSFPQNEANIKEVAKKLVDGLKKIEVCPFKGEINVKIISMKKDSQTESYGVYCNGSDGTYHKITTIDKYSENDWKIQKIRLNASTGSVKFNLSEELTIDESNPCYDCGPNKQGTRTYYEKITTCALVTGLSNESESYGIKVDDARCYLTFLVDGTYTLRVTAASTQGEKKTIKEVTAQGVCQNINEKPKTTINKIDEGLNQTFGPFNGSAQDKTLSHKETIKRTSPISGEEETITYEFNLTRD